eukprot:tig00000254_g22549.t1
MIFSIAFLETLKALRIVSYPRFEWNTAKKVLPVAVFYCLNVAFALASLRALNVPMYNVLKRLTTFVVMIQEAILLRKTFSTNTKIAVSIIVMGAILAGVSDVDFDLYSYAMAIGSCCVQSLYLIAVNKAGVEGDLNTFGLLFYNSVLSIPCLLVVLLATGEWRAAISYPHYGDFSFQAVMLVNLLMGTTLNYALFWCTQVNSALTTTIIGQLKVILSTAIGFFVFQGFPPWSPPFAPAPTSARAPCRLLPPGPRARAPRRLLPLAGAPASIPLARPLLPPSPPPHSARPAAAGLYYARVKWDEKQRKPLLPTKGSG